MGLMRIIFVLSVFAVSCAFFAAKPAFAYGDEFSEDDVYVEDVVINDSANEAGMFLLSYPDAELYNPPWYEFVAGVLQSIKDNGFVLADRYPDKGNSWTKVFSGGTNQIPGDSGFSLSVSTKGNNSGLMLTLGIGRYFYLTKENLGNSTFNDLLDLAESMEPNEENRVIPDPSQLSSIGFGIRCRYPDGTERDITDLITIEIELNEKDAGKLKLVYGCMLVDREITNEQEGKPLDGTGNTYLSDGKADSKIEATWWITNANIDSEKSGNGGCNSGFAGLSFAGLSVLMLVCALRRSKFLKEAAFNFSNFRLFI
jgi:hypothetical protein